MVRPRGCLSGIDAELTNEFAVKDITSSSQRILRVFRSLKSGPANLSTVHESFGSARSDWQNYQALVRVEKYSELHFILFFYLKHTAVMEVTRIRAVKLVQAIHDVLGRMRMYNIEKNSYSESMGLIDQLLQLTWRAVA